MKIVILNRNCGEQESVNLKHTENTPESIINHNGW
jgi:hypothetical protein